MACHRRCKNQLSITKELVIPGNKPDMERILRVVSTPRISRISSIKGKVIIAGDIEVLVEYVAVSQCNTQPVHFAGFKIPFSHFVEHRCAQPWQDAKVCAAIEFQDIKLMNRRKFTIFIILQAMIRELSAASIVVKSQEFTPENGSLNHSDCSQTCLERIEDCSEYQSCNCVSCTID